MNWLRFMVDVWRDWRSSTQEPFDFDFPETDAPDTNPPIPAGMWCPTPQTARLYADTQPGERSEPSEPSTMKTRTQAEWLHILIAAGVRPTVAAPWSGVFATVIRAGTFSAGDDDLRNFVGQVVHESQGLTRMVENLNYSALRLTQVWPSRFKTLASASLYAHNPERLANAVYGGRMGNSEPGDGWRYRGRSPLQITGRDNYAAVGELIGQDLTVLPELLEQPHFALEACIAWWEDRIPDVMLGDPVKVTRRVNGGIIGLRDRIALTQAAGEAMLRDAVA